MAYKKVSAFFDTLTEESEEINKAKANATYYRNHQRAQHFTRPPCHNDPLTNYDLKYVLFKGGRGGVKSFSCTGFLVEESFNYHLKDSLFIFGREIQTSVADSVYSLVVSFIIDGHFEENFTINKAEIINNLTGVRFVFLGFRSTGGKTAASQVNKIKGKFRLKYIFLDEAQDLSQETLKVLFPTVNRGGKIPLTPERENEVEGVASVAEIIEPESRFLFAMNPETPADPIIEKLNGMAIARKDGFKNSIAIHHINIFDLPEEFQDKELLKQAALDEGSIGYGHVWLGEPNPLLGGYPFRTLQNYQESADTQINTLIAFLDPSSDGKDRTAITFLGEDQAGKLVAWGRTFLQAWYLVVNEISELILQYEPDSFDYEQNFVGLHPQQEFRNKGIKAVARWSSHNKELKIYAAGAAVCPQNEEPRLSILKDHCSAEWHNHVINYNQDTSDFDDAPDSLSMALFRLGVFKMEKVKY